MGRGRAVATESARLVTHRDVKILGACAWVVLDAGNSQVALDTAPVVTHGGVHGIAHGSVLDRRGANPVQSRFGVRTRDEKLAEIGLVEHRHAVTARIDLSADLFVRRGPREITLAVNNSMVPDMGWCCRGVGLGGRLAGTQERSLGMNRQRWYW